MALPDVLKIEKTESFTADLIKGLLDADLAKKIAVKLDELDGKQDGNIEITANYEMQADKACKWLRDHQPLPNILSTWRWSDVENVVSQYLRTSIKPENRPFIDQLNDWFSAKNGSQFVEGIALLFGASPAAPEEATKDIPLSTPPILEASILPPMDSQTMAGMVQLQILFLVIKEQLPTDYTRFMQSEAIKTVLAELELVGEVHWREHPGHNVRITTAPEWMRNTLRLAREISLELKSKATIVSARAKLDILLRSSDFAQIKKLLSDFKLSQYTAPLATAGRNAAIVMTGTAHAPTLVPLAQRLAAHPDSHEAVTRRMPALSPSAIQAGARTLAMNSQRSPIVWIALGGAILGTALAAAAWLSKQDDQKQGPLP